MKILIISVIYLLTNSLISQVPHNALISSFFFEKSLADSSGNANNLDCYTDHLKTTLKNVDTSYCFGLDRFGKKGALRDYEHGDTNFFISKVIDMPTNMNSYAISLWVKYPYSRHCASISDFYVGNLNFAACYDYSILYVKSFMVIPDNVWTHFVFNVNFADSTIECFSNKEIYAGSKKIKMDAFAMSMIKTQKLQLFEEDWHSLGESVDDIMIFDRALTESEAVALRNYPAIGTVDVGDGVVTGLNDQINDKDLKVQLFPNPSNGNISISSPENDINRIEVLNIMGKVIAVYDYSGTRDCNLDLEGLGEGWYMLNVKTTEGVRREKVFIKD